MRHFNSQTGKSGPRCLRKFKKGNCSLILKKWSGSEGWLYWISWRTRNSLLSASSKTFILWLNRSQFCYMWRLKETEETSLGPLGEDSDDVMKIGDHPEREVEVLSDNTGMNIAFPYSLNLKFQLVPERTKWEWQCQQEETSSWLKNGRFLDRIVCISPI